MKMDQALTERLHAAGIPAVCVYTTAHRYSVGIHTAPLAHVADGSSIPYFTATRMSVREATAFVAGLCITAKMGA
jgi:hypothetical protein